MASSHGNPHFNPFGFCRCACDSCGSMDCICQDCPCDETSPVDAHREGGPKSWQNNPVYTSNGDYLNWDDAARYCGLRVSTFRSYVWNGQGPRPDSYFQRGKRRYPRWSRQYLDKWMTERRNRVPSMDTAEA